MNSKIYLIILGVILLIITPLVTWILAERTSPPHKMDESFDEFEGTVEELIKAIRDKYPFLKEETIEGWEGIMQNSNLYSVDSEKTWGSWHTTVAYWAIYEKPYPTKPRKRWNIYYTQMYISKLHKKLNNEITNEAYVD